MSYVLATYTYIHPPTPQGCSNTPSPPPPHHIARSFSFCLAGAQVKFKSYTCGYCFVRPDCSSSLTVQPLYLMRGGQSSWGGGGRQFGGGGRKRKGAQGDRAVNTGAHHHPPSPAAFPELSRDWLMSPPPRPRSQDMNQRRVQTSLPLSQLLLNPFTPHPLAWPLATFLTSVQGC